MTLHSLKVRSATTFMTLDLRDIEHCARTYMTLHRTWRQNIHDLALVQ